MVAYARHCVSEAERGSITVTMNILPHETMIIRPIGNGDEAAWREMWAAYCAFYAQSLPENVTANVWERIRGVDSATNSLIATSEQGTALGFANYILHPHTWSDKEICCLEDLYVRPEARGAGVGHALITYLIETGKSEGWGRVYWHTQTGNAPARRLYDRFNPADDFVRYTLLL